MLVTRVFTLALGCICAAASFALAQVAVFQDNQGDAVIRRTDPGDDGAFDPLAHRLPDLLEIRLGTFAPNTPHEDPFTGAWLAAGQYLRCDVVLDGLINPPGPIDPDKQVYDPFLYGPHPIVGYIELDADADENTGGDYDDERYRYLANVARFGGVPAEPRFAGRVALSNRDLDTSLATPPFCEKSGEEFHLVLEGDDIDHLWVILERPGGNPSIFEAGEIWRLKGDFLHRAHAFDEFTFTCIDEPDRYKPECNLRFAHDELTDTTTISLIFPLTNAACAALTSPGTPVQANDGCEDNQYSVLECLSDIRFSAANADPVDQQQPEFQFIAGWAARDPADYLDPSLWRVTALIGAPYESNEGGSLGAIHTDVYPDPLPGDFDGDGAVGPADSAALAAFIAAHDGDPLYDADGIAGNAQLAWPQFSRGFCVFDVDYDGVVVGGAPLGDMDINGILDFEDVDDFVQALIAPDVYTDTHGGADAADRGDFDGDGVCAGTDIQGFISALVAG